MATVIGIFEKQYLSGKKLTVVRPGSQRRKFTHINDTVKGCYIAWKKNLNRHYSLSNLNLIQYCKLPKCFQKIDSLMSRLGERNKSSVVKKIGDHKIYNIQCKTSLKIYRKFKKQIRSNNCLYINAI